MGGIPKPRLSRARANGWHKWDPIGFLPHGERWENNLDFADEYDQYLTSVASSLRRGASVSEAIAFLVDIEVRHMGLCPSNSAKASARETVAALSRDKDLWNFG